MSTPPPRSPLFPYTTLFRSARDRAAGGVRVDERRLQLQVGAETVRRGADQVLLRQARRQEVGAREAGAVGLRGDRCQRDRKRVVEGRREALGGAQSTIEQRE